MTAPLCQVDFYVLAAADKSAEKLVCSLAGKAWKEGHRIVVLTRDDASASHLDRLMWEYPEGRFLPHARLPADDPAPVGITADAKTAAAAGDRDVLINLSEAAIPEPGRFSRVLEIVPAEPRHREASREKFRHYRELGLDPVTHNL